MFLFSVFQFTHPVWGATQCKRPPRALITSFNSRTPCGVRQVDKRRLILDLLFQFTHPVWGATVGIDSIDTLLDVSIHAPRVGCDYVTLTAEVLPYVSIHAPRAGCDCYAPRAYCSTRGFNSRTPCGMRRGQPQTTQWGVRFQFTHPVWGATSPLSDMLCGMAFQFTHPVWGATLLHSTTCLLPYIVSIHAPRVGCDDALAPLEVVCDVSIHAPRVGCDQA